MIEKTGIGLLGIFAALVVNYLADVLPLTRRIGKPVCAKCGEPLSWKAYLLFSRCPHCLQSAIWRRAVVLVLYPVSFLLLWILPNERLSFIISAFLLVYLGVVFIIDLEYRAILHPTSIFGAIVFFVIGIYLHGISPTLLGGAAGFLIMLAIYYLGHIFAQWLAKRRGEELNEPALGFGDVNLAGIIGLGLGWPGVIAGLFLAILLGGLTSLVYLLFTLITKRYRPFLAIPYAPFLILALIFLLFRS